VFWIHVKLENHSDVGNSLAQAMIGTTLATTHMRKWDGQHRAFPNSICSSGMSIADASWQHAASKANTTLSEVRNALKLQLHRPEENITVRSKTESEARPLHVFKIDDERQSVTKTPRAFPCSGASLWT
jgi:hypothetical protein